MLTGKTKRGVSLRSTYGMKKSAPTRTWILVADRSRLSLFESNRNDGGTSVSLEKTISIPEGKKKGSELVADRPGRSFESRNSVRHGQGGATRHSYGRTRPQDNLLAERTVRRAVNLISDNWSDHARLYVLAEPKMIGLLRSGLKEKVSSRKISFVEKDLSWLGQTELVKRLEQFSRAK